MSGPAVSLTGQDVIVVNNRILTDLADGDCGMLAFASDIADTKVGKNGNAIMAQNNTGYQSDLTLRLLIGSADDQFLNSLMQLQFQDFASFTTLSGSFTKRVSDGQGNFNNVIYQTQAGIFTKQVEAKTNADGDTEQSVAVYHIRFTQTLTRTIQ